MELRRIIQARIDEINADMARTREMAEEKEKARKNQENADVADENTEANESNAGKRIELVQMVNLVCQLRKCLNTANSIYFSKNH